MRLELDDQYRQDSAEKYISMWSFLFLPLGAIRGAKFLSGGLISSECTVNEKNGLF